MCTSPLFTVVDGIKENGKKRMVFASSVDFVFDEYYYTFKTSNGEVCYKDGDMRITPVACRKCLDCRIRKAREWSCRAFLENRYHSSSCFITLTYNSENLPERGLEKIHVQNFIKLLRHSSKNKLSYFLVGEYGDKRARPHYHIILFGEDYSKGYEVRFFSKKKNRDIYRSVFLEKIWKKGYVTVDTFSEGVANYVSSYTSSKLKKSPVVGCNPIFQLQSLKPAIGKRWFEDNVETIMSTDEIFVNGRTFYSALADKVFNSHNPELHNKNKFNRVVKAGYKVEADMEDLAISTLSEFRQRKSEDLFKKRLTSRYGL